MLANLCKIGAKEFHQLTAVSTFMIINRVVEALFDFIKKLHRNGRKVVDEIEGILDFMRYSRRQLTQRGELLRLYQAILGGSQVFKRLRKFTRTGFDAFEQTNIFDGNCRLVGKGRYQLNLLLSERTHLRARQGHRPDRHAFSHHWNSEYSADFAQNLSLEGVFGVGFDVGNMNYLALKQSPTLR